MKNLKLVNSINSLYKDIDLRRRLQFFILIIINIFNGIVEFITLASASLFLEALSNPNSIENKIGWTKKILFILSPNIVLSTTLLFLVIIFLSTIIRIFNLWMNMKFRVSLLVYIEEKIFKKIINQELDYHINTSSTNIINDLTKNIDKTGFFIENLLSLITCSILSISLVIGLFKLSYLITLISIIVLSILYLIIGLLTNKKINLYSKYELKSTKDYLQIIQESLGSIKEIILNRKHDFFIKKFKYASYLSRNYQGLSGYVTTFPRYLFEGIGLIVIGSAGYVIYSLKGSNIIPIIGTFALGAQKLLPSMQTIYRSWQLLYFYQKGVNRILELLNLNYIDLGELNKNFVFRESILIKNLHHKYENSDNFSLENINLEIRQGENIGIMGMTGSGKTTFINILMGLLKPSKGSIMVDNFDITDKKNISYLYSWRKRINHVPQNIFLLNSTLTSNIAFGISKKNIDLNKIKFSIKKACLTDLVQSRGGKYNFLVGENGVKLSGGQKQRIGLARAIYNDLDILILDESTNALDKKTEREVIKNLYNLPNKKTTITISHSKESLLLCDRIIAFKNGKIERIISRNKFDSI